MAGIKSANRVFTARHTRNADMAIEEAQKVLEFSTEWAKSFRETAEKLLSIPVSPYSQNFTKVLNGIFPAPVGETDRQKKNRENTLSLVKGIYGNEKNGGGFGYNGWTTYNAIVEYLDHYRDAQPNERAIASMDNNSWVTLKKIKTQELVLSLA